MDHTSGRTNLNRSQAYIRKMPRGIKKGHRLSNVRQNDLEYGSVYKPNGLDRGEQSAGESTINVFRIVTICNKEGKICLRYLSTRERDRFKVKKLEREFFVVHCRI